MFSKKTLTLTIVYIGIYLLSTGAAAWGFGTFRKPPSSPASSLPVTSADGKVAINPGEPKDRTCPVSGELFTKTEETIWKNRRPVLAMVENHVEARPQSGLASADLIYEAIAEGGITRFMGVFYCKAVADGNKIAPVRSARIYFVNIAAEYNTPVYVHVGGGNCSRDQASGQCTSNKKAWALEEMIDMGWRKRGGNDFDTTLDTGYPALGRDYNRLGADKVLATEHTMVGFLPKIWDQAEKRGLGGVNEDGSTWESGFRSWKFREDAKESDRGSATAINFDFWEGYKEFTAHWDYDKQSNSYLRSTGGEPHLDLETNKQLSAKNVVIQFSKEQGPLDEHKHMLYEVIGKGSGLIFQDGNVIEIAWEKPNQLSRTIFKDKKSGAEIAFVKGSTWIEVVPAGNEIVY